MKLCQSGPQDSWTILRVATPIECINDEYESALLGARKIADEVKEEIVLHRLACPVWVATKASCHNVSKGGEDYGEFVDESQENGSWLAQIWVIPPAEKRSSKVLSLKGLNELTRFC